MRREREKGRGSAHRGVDAVGTDADAADECEPAAVRLVERGERCGVGNLRVLVVEKHAVSISVSASASSLLLRRRVHGRNLAAMAAAAAATGGSSSLVLILNSCLGWPIIHICPAYEISSSNVKAQPT